ncbi:amino acid permease [Candidatus Woesearchaeota archaeon]|nr:amino acid permease [Candidatus Woesearchaeota archaeon]
MAELKKTLSFPVVLIITINSIMGTGIFFLPAVGAGISGPASILAWLIMAVLSMGISLIFAELVGMFPFSGGVYEYTKQAFGPLTSFLVGWMTMIAGNVTIAMLVVGAVQYLGPNMPMLRTIGISIGFILAFNYMAYRGMQTSAVMLVAFGIVTMFTVLSLTIPGLINLNTGNFIPFFTTDLPLALPLVFLTIFYIAETFFGWETATFLAGETKDAERVMPRAMWLGTLLIAVMVLLFVISSLGTIPWQEFGLSKTPLSDLAGVHFGLAATDIFSLLVYLSIIGSVAGWIVSAPRLLMSLAEDKLFIPQLADIHPKYNTPHKSIIFQTILTSILVVVGAGKYETLLHLLLPMVLVLYIMVILSFVVMRFTKKDQPRPFKVWGGLSLSFLLMAFLAGLIFIWIHDDPTASLNILRLAGGLGLLGVPFFFLLTFYYNPDAIVKVSESFAKLNLFFEGFILPRKIRKEILMTLPELTGKKVLDFGAGVGTLTRHLIRNVGEEGHIIATDMSKKNLNILEKRLKKKKHLNFTVIHDPHAVNRVHPDIPFVDVVVSVGMISYIQDMKGVLSDLNRLMPEGGEICFVEFIDYFWFLPNAGWLKDEEKLLQLFQSAGFQVQLVKVKGTFWKYLMIYGKKAHHRGDIYI